MSTFEDTDITSKIHDNIQAVKVQTQGQTLQKS